MNTKPQIRDYQREAIDHLQDNHYRGMFEMATGTGKTITSIFAVDRCKSENGRMVVVIFVPFIHLVSQWEKEIKRFTTQHKIIKCYGSRKQWLYVFEDYTDKINEQKTELFFVISTYRTACTSIFIDHLKAIKDSIFLIADECHYFGSYRMKMADFSFVQFRLGLSATPKRWWDEDGSNHIARYFEKTVYEFPIHEAIDKGFLTRYKYRTILVSLIREEVESYDELTERIVKLMNSDDPEDLERAKDLAILRRRIITNAALKKTAFTEELEKMKSDQSHTLVYCGPTEIEEIIGLVSRKGFTVSRFDQKLKNDEREKILGEFSRGNIQFLVAIKCLDEGVDVPSTKTAYFLASTTNPKEFIQRRGRVLRNAPGKRHANIVDFVVAPTDYGQGFFLEIIQKELPRVAEFSDYAMNKYESRRQLWDLMKVHNLEYLLNKKSWEVYYENQIERALNLL
jgi:superfamily II DNA or RNA helicase